MATTVIFLITGLIIADLLIVQFRTRSAWPSGQPKDSTTVVIHCGIHSDNIIRSSVATRRKTCGKTTTKSVDTVVIQ